jgi:elongation factor G
MGELHLEIIVDRLKREYKIECNTGTPQVSYKEAITASVKHHEVYKKQTGGRGKFADITVELSPADPGVKGLQFISEIKGGALPKEYIRAVQTGFEGAMMNGVLAGYAMDSLKVTLLDGATHPVDSDDMAFEIAARIAFKEACRKAKTVLLEPIMHVEVSCPEQYVGDVTGDLNKRRAHLEGIHPKARYHMIQAFVPLSEMFGYITHLRSMSSGRANSSMEFSHYEPVPENLAEEVIYRVKGYVEKY